MTQQKHRFPKPETEPPSRDTLTAGCYHVPVLLHASVDALVPEQGGVFVDVTFGGGGHSKALLDRLPAGSRLLGFDQDADALQNAPTDERFTFVRSNFRYLANWMRYYDIPAVDGVLADLGVSSHHFDDEQRGFSFRFNAPLDMRMNTRATLTAQTVVNEYEEERLADVFYLYGELKTARKLAAAIVKARRQQPIVTTFDLLQATEPFLKKEREKKDAAKLFQALRMEVNQETEALQEMLLAATKLLKPGGRLAVITYHSIEDRMVKNLMRTGNLSGRVEQDFYGRTLSPLKPVNNKVITPCEEELKANPRSRSAKLRIAEKL